MDKALAIESLAAWRCQAEYILIGPRARGEKRLARRLVRLLDEIDTIWLKDLGPDYLAALSVLLAEHEVAQAPLPSLVTPGALPGRRPR